MQKLLEETNKKPYDSSNILHTYARKTLFESPHELHPLQHQ